MNGRAPSPGIMTKPPCGHWYMGHGHPWLIHAPSVILASLLSIGFMTSHSCNLGSCIMSWLNWYIPPPTIFIHFYTFPPLSGRYVFQSNSVSRVETQFNPCFNSLWTNRRLSAFFCARAKQQLLTVTWADSVSLLGRSGTCECTRQEAHLTRQYRVRWVKCVSKWARGTGKCHCRSSGSVKQLLCIHKYM